MVHKVIGKYKNEQHLNRRAIFNSLRFNKVVIIIFSIDNNAFVLMLERCSAKNRFNMSKLIINESNSVYFPCKVHYWQGLMIQYIFAGANHFHLTHGPTICFTLGQPSQR